MSYPIKRILIADQFSLVRQGVRSFLTNHSSNWQIVAEAANGREALQLAEEWHPDIAILGCSLPSLNGIELTRAIKRMWPRTEVLIYSRYATENVVAEALQAGARGYVLKTDSGEQLVDAVAALCQRKPWFSSEISETLLERLMMSSRPEQEQSTLTAREREVVQLVAEGKITKQIAGMLGLSTKTVESHRNSAMQKLNYHTTAQLVRFAIRNNIIEA
jgi:DNA-binding NarL/FixJ family response regulator